MARHGERTYVKIRLELVKNGRAAVFVKPYFPKPESRVRKNENCPRAGNCSFPYTLSCTFVRRPTARNRWIIIERYDYSLYARVTYIENVGNFENILNKNRSPYANDKYSSYTPRNYDRRNFRVFLRSTLASEFSHGYVSNASVDRRLLLV